MISTAIPLRSESGELIRDRLAGRWLLQALWSPTRHRQAVIAWHMTPLLYRSSGLLIASSNRPIVVKIFGKMERMRSHTSPI